MTPTTITALIVWLLFLLGCLALLAVGPTWSRINAWIETTRRQQDAEDRASAAAWDANHGEARQFSETPIHDGLLTERFGAWLDSLPETGVER